MDFGPLEILMVVVVALIVFGPGKIPEIMRTFGKVTRNFRKATSEFTGALTREFELEEKREQEKKTAEEKAKTDAKAAGQLALPLEARTADPAKPAILPMTVDPSPPADVPPAPPDAPKISLKDTELHGNQ